MTTDRNVIVDSIGVHDRNCLGCIRCHEKGFDDRSVLVTALSIRNGPHEFTNLYLDDAQASALHARLGMVVGANLAAVAALSTTRDKFYVASVDRKVYDEMVADRDRWKALAEKPRKIPMEIVDAKFHSWWGASKYCQVVHSGPTTMAMVKDGAIAILGEFNLIENKGSNNG
jgi:hypothetical protein